MAKYPIVRSCGHSETVEVLGPHYTREAYLRRLESSPCWNCRRIKAANQAAVRAQDAGWPRLEGTPKQIAWALTLRDQAIQSVQRFLAEARAKAEEQGTNPTEIDHLMNRYQSLIPKLIGQTKAAWWIDHRGLSPRLLLREVAPEEMLR